MAAHESTDILIIIYGPKAPQLVSADHSGVTMVGFMIPWTWLWCGHYM